MSELAVASVSLRRLLRDRRALMMMTVLPILIVLILGMSIRGFSTFKVGVVDEGAGAAGARLVAALQASPSLDVSRYASTADASLALSRGEVAAAVVLPRGMAATLQARHRAEVGVMSEQANSTQQAAVAAVTSVIDTAAQPEQAAQFSASMLHVSYAEALQAALQARAHLALVGVRAREVQRTQATLPEGFSYSAPTMLVLFVFISAMSGGAMLIEVRRWHLYERMLAAPVGPASIVGGEFLALLAVALGQSLLIVAVAALAFGVSWGSPLAAGALVVVWAVVAAGAGMLGATLFRTPEQATALGSTLGIVLGMLGGCMWPLSIVSPTFRALGHVTPQSWAVDGWTALLSRGASITGIAGELAVLAGFAVVLLVAATRRLRGALA